MAGKKSDLGPTGIDLSHTVRRLRGELTYNELSRRLTDIGRDIPPLGLRRIEAGTRRVDVDDLMALAVVLGVSPIALLTPPSSSAQTMVTGTATGKHRADMFRSWLRDVDPLKGGPGPQNFIDFALRSRPGWALDTLGDELQARKEAHQAEMKRRAAAKKKRQTADGDN
jgi:hypothetical protein